MPSNRTITAIAILLGLSCAQAAPGDTQRSGAPAPAATTIAEASPSADKGQNELLDQLAEETPTEPFTDGAQSFAKVKETLLQNYYAEGLTEDDVYRAATAGMLEKLDPKMRKWNRLMSARELAELENDLKGEVVGIGAQIDFDAASGYADVMAALPGSPAEKAGLQAGDKIVTVNGRLYKGMRLKDVVADIRGKAGEPVTLSILRGDKLVAVTVTRDRVVYDTATHAVMPDDVGYLKIPGFNEKTAAAVRAALEDLTAKKVSGLVLDLRANPGGSFDAAIETADLMLPEGAPVVSTKRRNKAEEKHLAKGPSFLTDVPITVLVDGQTGSGAEFVAGALAEDRHALLVGQKTKGKWSVQMIDNLSNGYAFKYTVSMFKTPSGKSYEGVGMSPDVEVSMDEKTFTRAAFAKSMDERLGIDVQLRTARELATRRP